MPKIILPFQGAAAAGKNGKSENSLIYARTSSECEAQKMVTYTKSYKAPVQPNSALQLLARDKMRQLILSLKAYQPYYVQGSLYGTYPVLESSFVSDRSRYISLVMRNGLSVFHSEVWLEASDSAFRIKLCIDDLFGAYFSWTDFFFAIQIRGDQVDCAFYRDQFKVNRTSFSVDYPLYGREATSMDHFESVNVDETDFDGKKPYTCRLWASPIAFPSPPANNQIDATSTWDIGNSVRMDFLFNVI